LHLDPARTRQLPPCLPPPKKALGSVLRLLSSVLGPTAFGLGIEHLALPRYEITDPAGFSENDLRFLRQF